VSKLITVSLLRLKFPFSLAEGEQEVLLEDCDGWVLEIIPQMLPAVFGLLKAAFSRCCRLLDSSILFPSRLLCGLWGRFPGFAIEERSGSWLGFALEAYSNGYSHFGDDDG
jgi:hypothetical protein